MQWHISIVAVLDFDVQDAEFGFTPAQGADDKISATFFDTLVLGFEQLHAVGVNVELEQQIGEICCHAFEQLLLAVSCYFG